MAWCVCRVSSHDRPCLSIPSETDSKAIFGDYHHDFPICQTKTEKVTNQKQG